MARHHHAPFEPSPTDRALAAALGEDVAFLPSDLGVLAVRRPRGEGEPRSAVSELVRAVWALDPAQGRRRLRERIRLTSAPAPFDPDLVKVAARRWARVDPAPGDAPEVRWMTPPPDPPVLKPPPGSDTIGGWMDWARAQRAGGDHPVVAVLVDPDGHAIAAAHNTELDRAAHAEWTVLRAAWPVPPGTSLVTTLQCCRMCAASWASCAPEDVAVWYGEEDPGPFARGTRLASRERRCG